MSNDFAALKKSSGDISSLQSAMEKLKGPGRSADNENVWKLEVDKAGNGFAVIRFLPAPAGENDPFVCLYNHFFKGPTGQYYAENSLTTIGQNDPVSEFNAALWATGTEDNQNLVRKRKRQTNYWSNIYVVKDPANPENEGKVFKYRYGKKIFDKINLMMFPEYEGETAVNPFDLWTGCNFKLKAHQDAGFRSYERSEWEAPSPLLDDDSKLEEIWKAEYSLQEMVSADKFKPYDVLAQRLAQVLCLDSNGVAQTPVRSEANETADYDSGPSAPAAEIPSVSADEDAEIKAMFDELDAG